MKKVWLLLLLASIICCTGCNSTDENSETEVEIDYGEGTPSKEIIDVEEGQEYSVGETIVLESAELSYELVIDKVSYAEVENAYEDVPEHVVLVDYTYKNNCDEILLIGDMRFQLVTAENDHVYDPYYYDENGMSISAQIAFALEDNKDVALIYRDTVDTDIEPVYIRIDEISESN